MAIHNDIGKLGEEKAIDYLLSKGYKILQTNWRYGKEEVDIIAENDNYLGIIEVKTRSTGAFGSPQEFISRKKQLHLIKAANAYAEKYAIEKDIYFDIIAITLSPSLKIEHIIEAFHA